VAGGNHARKPRPVRPEDHYPVWVIHLSGRDLAQKLSQGMKQIHSWRVDTLARLGSDAETESRP